MPEAQLTEPLDRAAEKGGVKETFAALEAAVEADVDAFLRRESVNAQDFETLLQTVHRRALATATRVVNGRWKADCMTSWSYNPFFSHRRGDTPCHCRPVAAAPSTEKRSALPHAGLRPTLELVRQQPLSTPNATPNAAARSWATQQEAEIK